MRLRSIAEPLGIRYARSNRFGTIGAMESEKDAESGEANEPGQSQPVVSPVTGEGAVPAQSPVAGDAPHVSGFPIVGIGASAGGLAAFESFFCGMPAGADPGMAFVLVQHLAPDHKSILTELVRRYTRMQVLEVADGMRVQPGSVYIIPPDRDMALLNGTLQLLEPSEPRGRRLPIDFFFRSLAMDRHERAIGVVLSGTGSDGTQGVRAIKGEGGMVMVQDPESAEFDGMPRSAIATGLVDYELPSAAMPAQLIAYAAHAFGKLPRISSALEPGTANALKKIHVLLRHQTGHDFSQYKPSTIQRRIERRMSVHQINVIEAYVKFLQRTPAEVATLFRELLIGVTSFFRDSEAFQSLEAQISARLLSEVGADSVIRVWTAGCSTGEEAYSIAMLLQERLEALKQNRTVQIFATDIDSRAIDTARAGIYPAGIAADVTPERLTRFFTAESGGAAYRISKRIREMVIFSEQDVIKDPPFSKLDLISCRNLLIYLGADLQKRLISLFAYALNPGGILFLGTSESVGDTAEMFSLLDRKSKLYQRREDFPGKLLAARNLMTPHATAIEAALPRRSNPDVTALPRQLPLRELTERALLQQFAAAGALVSGSGEILYLHGRTGMYLEPSPGEAGSSNILKMAREGLRLELTTALHRAAGTKQIVRCPGLQVKSNGHYTLVNLTVCPLAIGSTAAQKLPLFLVVLQEMPAFDPLSSQPLADSPDAGANARIAALEQELRSREEYLHSTHEELETSNEELKSANEEMQSVNEELQSTNEELETSKEELQSVNEELATVNAELQTKVVDLSRANNDMNNLLAGTGSAPCLSIINSVFCDSHPPSARSST
jgi:two-component system CheB/CheR fusion protein